jgi:hypothetical protein
METRPPAMFGVSRRFNKGGKYDDLLSGGRDDGSGVGFNGVGDPMEKTDIADC